MLRTLQSSSKGQEHHLMNIHIDEHEMTASTSFPVVADCVTGQRAESRSSFGSNLAQPASLFGMLCPNLNAG